MCKTDCTYGLAELKPTDEPTPAPGFTVVQIECLQLAAAELQTLRKQIIAPLLDDLANASPFRTSADRLTLMAQIEIGLSLAQARLDALAAICTFETMKTEQAYEPISDTANLPKVVSENSPKSEQANENKEG